MCDPIRRLPFIFGWTSHIQLQSVQIMHVHVQYLIVEEEEEEEEEDGEEKGEEDTAYRM